MIYIVQKEIAFNSLCRGMATDNLSLAKQYAQDAMTGAFARFTNNSKGTSLTLKNRCINLAKASGLAARAPLLYIPFVNRITQLALRFLSPELTNTCINSSSFFKRDEMHVRYSQYTRHKFVEEYFRDNIKQKKRFDPSHLHLFNEVGFHSKECENIFKKLSPPLSIDFINSSEFYAEDEIHARYSQDTRNTFVESYFKEKIANKQATGKQVIGRDLKISNKNTITFKKIGLSVDNCLNVILNFLAQSPEISRSSHVKEQVEKYLRAKNTL